MKLEAQEVQLSSGGTAVVYGCGCVEIVQSDKTESDLGLIVTADDIALLHTITAALVRQNEVDDSELEPTDEVFYVGDNPSECCVNGDDVNALLSGDDLSREGNT